MPRRMENDPVAQMLYKAKTLHKGESLFCGYTGRFYQHEAICNDNNKIDRMVLIMTIYLM